MNNLTLLTTLSLSSLFFLTKGYTEELKIQNKNRVSAGPKAHYTDLNAKDLGSFTGGAGGIFLEYERVNPNALFARSYGQYSYASLKGSGSSKIEQSEYFLGGSLGYTIQRCKTKQYSLSPYVGCAYHHIDEKRTIDGYSPYRANYSLPFIPLGALFLFEVNSYFSFGLDYQYQFSFKPEVKLSYMKGSLWKLKKEGSQYVEMTFAFKVRDYLDIRVMPYYRYLQTGASTAVNSVGNPLGIQKQTYQTYGGNLAVSYLF